VKLADRAGQGWAGLESMRLAAVAEQGVGSKVRVSHHGPPESSESESKLKCFFLNSQCQEKFINCTFIAPKNPGNNQMRVDGIEAYRP
jgi:hypothetical protein